MIRIASIFTLVLGFTSSSFGAFGTPQWTTAPNVAAEWPGGSTNVSMRVGNLTALACLRDGALERRYANSEDNHSGNMPSMNLTVANNPLMAATNHVSILGCVSAAMNNENLFSSADTPEIPVYDMCNCANPSVHAPGNAYRLGRCAANLNTSGLIWNNSFDGAYSSNFFCQVNAAFEFGSTWHADPWNGITWLTLAGRSNTAAADYAFSDSKKIAYQPVLNSLALLPAFDRTLEFFGHIQSINPYIQRRNLGVGSEFEQEVKFYECIRSYTLMEPFSVGSFTTFYITEYEELLCTNSVTTNVMVGPVVCSYMRYEGKSDSYGVPPMIQVVVDVGKGEGQTQEEWEQQNPTAGELLSGDYTLIDTWNDNGVTYKRFRGEMMDADDWDYGGTIFIEMTWRHISSSVRTFYPREYSVDDPDHLYPLNDGNGVVPEWQNHVDSSSLFTHLRGSSTRNVDGVQTRNATNLHATVCGSNYTNLFDTIISKVNAYSNAPECDSSTSPTIQVTVDARGMELPSFAPVYVWRSTLDEGTKVLPSAIYYDMGGHFFIEEGTSDVFTLYPDPGYSDSGSYIDDTTRMNLIGTIKQVDWNFKSITK